MIPVEILGPVHQALRAHASVSSPTCWRATSCIFFLLGLIFILGHAAVALVAVPFAIGIYLLELFVAFVQAYVFTMLSALFIGMGVAMGHHDEHGHEHARRGAHATTTARPTLSGQSGERAGRRRLTRTRRSNAAAGGRPKGHPRPPHKWVQTSKVTDRNVT